MNRRTKRTPSSRLPRELLHAAMDLERRTMNLYCRFENLFADRDEIRSFWFDMAQHESRHFGALALVDGLLEATPRRGLPTGAGLTRERVQHLRALLDRFDAEVQAGLPLARAFEIALEIKSSEIEDVVLDLLSAVKGEEERERAAQLLIHDLGDLGYMIEKYTNNHALLARADEALEHRVGRLRRKPPTRPRLRRVKG